MDFIGSVIQEHRYSVALHGEYLRDVATDTAEQWAVTEKQMDEYDLKQAKADKARNDLEAYTHECSKLFQQHQWGEATPCPEPTANQLRELLQDARWAVEHECQDEAVRTSSCRLPYWSGKCFLFGRLAALECMHPVSGSLGYRRFAFHALEKSTFTAPNFWMR